MKERRKERREDRCEERVEKDNMEDMIRDVGAEDFAQAHVYETMSAVQKLHCMLVQLSSRISGFKTYEFESNQWLDR